MEENSYERYNWTREDMAANCRPEKMGRCGLVYTVEQIAQLTYSRKVFCFGSGKIGIQFVETLAIYDFNEQNLMFVDNDMEKHETIMSVGDYSAIKIISKKMMIDLIDESDFILYTMSLYHGLYEIQWAINEYKNEQRKIHNILYYDTVGKGAREISVYDGRCLICNQDTRFTSIGKQSIPRYDCLCVRCLSNPRERAVVHAINRFFPLWKNCIIHESSPTLDNATTQHFSTNCERYFTSQYFQGIQSGELVEYQGNRILCEDLGDMSFADDSIDLFITQDVFEHILKPAKAFKEIARVLKSGGAHIFTLPWFSEYQTTHCRAKEVDGKITYLEKKMYHGNPVDQAGSLVTNDWGVDLMDFIHKCSGMRTMVYLYENKELGLEGEFLEVFISYKE
ncbi:MAG: class I SAM-dependent methyltransferase [Eubacteriales bacterium]